MNKRIKKLWIEALRSGEYRQGRDQLVEENLHGGDDFCCLGVLTDLYVQERGNPTRAWGGWKGQGYYLAPRVWKWAGLDGYNPLVEKKLTLANANDRGDSFIKIAGLIERNL